MLRRYTVDPRPKLWHLKISLYSEKVRWALDYKGVDAERLKPTPGLHPLKALWLTRGHGRTLPVLELDGRRYGDSTAAIAALEARFPEPPLYPARPDALRRALELETFFDDEVAPPIRHALFHELWRDREHSPELLPKLFGQSLVTRSRHLGNTIGRVWTRSLYGVGPESRAKTAREMVVRGLDRLERELDDREYLVEDRFTVADLTAAAVFHPLVLPPEGPLHNVPAAWRRFRESLADRPGYRWVERTFARHRAPARSGGSRAPAAA
jgi:glutathione S-transferase